MHVNFMISHFTSSRSTSAPQLLALLNRWLFAAAKAGWREWKTQRAIVELNGQDDFVLLDLGIRRDQIETVVRGGRYDLDPPRRR